MQDIPPNKHNLSKASGYFNRHFELLKYFSNQEEAYNHLEGEYYQIYNKYRYTTYSSFKRCKNYHYGVY